MKILRYENIFIFSIITTLALLVGYFINFKLNFIFGDALTRTFKAYIVFFGNYPKLVSIGLVWPPLPTLLQFPLVLIPAFDVNGFAGNILTSVFLGFTSVYLNKTMKLFALERWLRYGLILLFVTNPMIIFYGANGMSEMVAISFLLMTTYFLLNYFDTKQIHWLILSSGAFSCAILVRFELVTLLSIMLTLFVLVSLEDKKYRVQKAEALICLYFFPVAFIILVWLLVNWLIQGNPFDFLLGLYSNSHQAAKLLSTTINFRSLKGNIFADLLFVGKRVFFLTPFLYIFITIVLLRLSKKTHLLYSLSLLGFPVLILLFHIMFMFLGQSFGYLRFLIYLIPFYYLLAGFVLSKRFFHFGGNRTRLLLIIVFMIFLTVSSLTTAFAMSSTEFGGDQEHIFVEALRNGHNNSPHYNYKTEIKIAQYLEQKIRTRSILVDDSVAFPIIYFSHKPQLFIETVDNDFKQILANPAHSQKVKYILVDNQDRSSNTDILNVSYPRLFSYGTNFTTLEKDFGDWRLYKIIR